MLRIKRWPNAVVDAAWVSAGTYSMYAAMFGVTVIINRGYGTAELGRFGFAWAVAQLLVQSLVAGFTAILKRNVARSPESLGDLVSESLAARLVTFALVLPITWLLLSLAGVNGPVAWAVILLVLAKAIEATGLTFAEGLQAAGGNRTFAVLSLFNGAVLLAVVEVVWIVELEITNVYVGAVTAAVLYTGTALAVFIRQCGAPSFAVNPGRVAALVGESWPLIVNAFIFVLTSRATVIIVGLEAGAVQAGVYTLASGLVGAFAVLASAIGVVIFPELCRVFIKSPEALRAYVYRLSLNLGAVGVLAATLLILARGSLLSLYGDVPLYAGDVLFALGLGLVPIFGTVAGNYIFTAIGEQKDGMYCSMVQAVLLMSLVIPLTRWLGALGAAGAVSVAQVIMWIVLLVWLDRRHLTRLVRGARQRSPTSNQSA
jgi:O-antigen/teichoic acid export membrane protein